MFVPRYLHRVGAHVSVKFADGAPTVDLPYWDANVERREMVLVGDDMPKGYVEDESALPESVIVAPPGHPEFTIRVPVRSVIGEWWPITNPGWNPYVGQIIEETPESVEQYGGRAGRWIITIANRDVPNNVMSTRFVASSMPRSGATWCFDDPLTARRIIRVVPEEEQTWPERVCSAWYTFDPWLPPDISAFEKIRFDPPIDVAPRTGSPFDTRDGVALAALLSPGWNDDGSADWPSSMEELIDLVAEHVQEREDALRAAARQPTD